VTLAPSGGGEAGAKRLIVSAWVLENCSQAVNVRSVVNASTDTPSNLSTLGAILGPGELSDAILVMVCNDNTAGSIQITIGQIALTEDFDLDQGGSSRGAAGTNLTSPSVGPVGVAAAYTVAATQRAALSAIRIAQVAGPITGGSAVLTLEAA
jgi:hypothetical protein